MAKTKVATYHFHTDLHKKLHEESSPIQGQIEVPESLRSNKEIRRMVHGRLKKKYPDVQESWIHGIQD